ncbi:MAG: hypothetical protein E4H20_02050 [Spirochaetales bacterium]|nr:MAG: hypothetical protein E4H20_02050 [Spirochaetales bacterium]
MFTRHPYRTIMTTLAVAAAALLLVSASPAPAADPLAVLPSGPLAVISLDNPQALLDNLGSFVDATGLASIGDEVRELKDMLEGTGQDQGQNEDQADGSMQAVLGLLKNLDLGRRFVAAIYSVGSGDGNEPAVLLYLPVRDRAAIQAALSDALAGSSAPAPIYSDALPGYLAIGLGMDAAPAAKTDAADLSSLAAYPSSSIAVWLDRAKAQSQLGDLIGGALSSLVPSPDEEWLDDEYDYEDDEDYSTDEYESDEYENWEDPDWYYDEDNDAYYYWDESAGEFLSDEGEVYPGNGVAEYFYDSLEGMYYEWDAESGEYVPFDEGEDDDSEDWYYDEDTGTYYVWDNEIGDYVPAEDDEYADGEDYEEDYDGESYEEDWDAEGYDDYADSGIDDRSLEMLGKLKDSFVSFMEGVGSVDFGVTITKDRVWLRAGVGAVAGTVLTTATEAASRGEASLPYISWLETDALASGVWSTSPEWALGIFEPFYRAMVPEGEFAELMIGLMSKSAAASGSNGAFALDLTVSDDLAAALRSGDPAGPEAAGLLERGLTIDMNGIFQVRDRQAYRNALQESMNMINLPAYQELMSASQMKISTTRQVGSSGTMPWEQYSLDIAVPVTGDETDGAVEIMLKKFSSFVYTYSGDKAYVYLGPVKDALEQARRNAPAKSLAADVSFRTLRAGAPVDTKAIFYLSTRRLAKLILQFKDQSGPLPFSYDEMAGLLTWFSASPGRLGWGAALGAGDIKAMAAIFKD